MSNYSSTNWPTAPVVAQAPEVKSQMRFSSELGARLSPENHTKLVNHLLRLLHTNNGPA